MTTVLDGGETLKAILSHPNLFPKAMTEASKFARDLIMGELKGKDITTEKVRSIFAAVGERAFLLVADELADPVIKKLFKLLDPHHPDVKTASIETSRQGVADLLSESAHPHEPASKVKKAATRSSKTKAAKDVESTTAITAKKGAKRAPAKPKSALNSPINKAAFKNKP